MTVDFSRIEDKHALDQFYSIIGSQYREPDLAISDGENGVYLYRWWITPHMDEANVYAHYQIASDPARPPHDHPWDNMSVMLTDGYKEMMDTQPGTEHSHLLQYRRQKGDTIFRHAHWAHRLILPADVGGVLTIFSTGPKINTPWGFWHDGKKYSHKACLARNEFGHSVFKLPTTEEK